MQDESYGPGPIERRWTSRLQWRLFGRWPDAVVAERLGRLNTRPMPDHLLANFKRAWLDEVDGGNAMMDAREKGADHA